MSKLPGDDALFSVLDEMSSTQPGSNKTKDQNTVATLTSVSHWRLLPEIDGYPSDKQMGSSCIWNPYIEVPTPSSPSSSGLLLPPTNPTVEVFRRRAFEKFKSKFQSNWTSIHTMANQQARNNVEKKDKDNLWNDLSVVTILEKWHFAMKLQEQFRLRQEGLQQFDHVGTASASQTTATVFGQLVARRQTQLLLDPILISSSLPNNNHNNNNKRHKSGDGQDDHHYHQQHPTTATSFELLKQEIELDWTRAWRKHVGSKKRDDELQEVFNSNTFRKRIKKLNRALQEAAYDVESTFWSDLQSRVDQEEQLHPQKLKSKSIPKIAFGTGKHGDMVSVTHFGLSFYILETHYEKVQRLYDRSHRHIATSNNKKQQEYQDGFACALFCLLARYDMLEGAGLQSGLHGAVFDFLLTEFDCRMECFASPLNCRYEHFCSAFGDTDGSFGSVGSFFDYDFALHGGCYQANPPFVSDLILQMIQTMNRQMTKSNTKPLMFVVFVPAWTETNGYQALLSSEYLEEHVSLSQANHYYFEGTQHRRHGKKFRVASFDTTVFFLQNETAKTKWPITRDVLNAFRVVFETNPNEESKSVTRKSSKISKSLATASINQAQIPTNEDQPVAPTSLNNEKKRRKSKKPHKGKKQKRRIVSDEKDQLDILNSLGLK